MLRGRLGTVCERSESRQGGPTATGNCNDAHESPASVQPVPYDRTMVNSTSRTGRTQLQLKSDRQTPPQHGVASKQIQNPEEHSRQNIDLFVYDPITRMTAHANAAAVREMNSSRPPEVSNIDNFRVESDSNTTSRCTSALG